MRENYEPVIGLEVHIQLKTVSKLFCSSPNDFSSSTPNTNICEVCTGQPGSLPVLNVEAVKKAILVGLALNCEIATNTNFDRKNYFYPDLPKGYQISQFDHPINGHGEVKIGGKTIGITRAHLEEDAGKLIHGSDGKSYVDFNRAGVPLLEVVTDPDFESSKQAVNFLYFLRATVRYLNVSDADMEKGHLRVDANVSVRKKGEKNLPSYKVEVKNMNSFKAVETALEYEIDRQIEMLENGQTPVAETRGYLDDTKETISQRGKEEAHDYRYFPEQDLPPLKITSQFVDELRKSLPELPAKKVERFEEEYSLTNLEAWQIVEDKSLASYFEQAMSELTEWSKTKGISDENYKLMVKNLIKWLLGDYLALVYRDGDFGGHGANITPENFAEFITLLEEKVISISAGKTVLYQMYSTGADPSTIVDEQNLTQISDSGVIEEKVLQVIEQNQDIVEKYKSGKTSVIGVLVGKVIKEMGGAANPAVVNEILEKKLKN